MMQYLSQKIGTKMTVVHSAFWLVIFFSLSGDVNAQLFKCIATDGTIYYQDSLCPKSDAQNELITPKRIEDEETKKRFAAQQEAIKNHISNRHKTEVEELEAGKQKEAEQLRKREVTAEERNAAKQNTIIIYR